MTRQAGTSLLKKDKLTKIEPFRAMDVVSDANALIANGHDVIMMCVGQPAAPAAKSVIEAAKSASASGRMVYTNAGGIDPLKKRIAQHYQEHYQVEIDPSRVIVTTGSSAGFVLSFMALFEPGDRVAIPAPGYPAYRNILRSLAIEPVIIETTAESGWVITPELLEAEHNAKPLNGVLIANPNNPNGTMMQPSDFSRLLEKSNALGISFISDEIYHGLTFNKPEITALSLQDDVVIINSFSKYYCMTGWRIGWMVVPQDMVELINRLQQNVFICAPEISQIAALAAFDGRDEMEAVRKGYETNAEIVSAGLKRLGINNVQPIDGAFYAYFDVSPWLARSGTADSMQLSGRILKEALVALTSGFDFDTERGGAWMRLSFACTKERLVEGFDRLENWLNGLEK